MTKLIRHAKIIILPTLGRMNCQRSGRQVSRCCKYQTRVNGGLEWDTVKEVKNKWIDLKVFIQQNQKDFEHN